MLLECHLCNIRLEGSHVLGLEVLLPCSTPMRRWRSQAGVTRHRLQYPVDPNIFQHQLTEQPLQQSRGLRPQLPRELP